MATRTIATFTAGLVGNLDGTAQFAMADKNGATRRYTLAQVRPVINDATARVADLLFTDATYDIGKSGATRPRDGFFSRNLTVGARVYAASHFQSAAGNGVVALLADTTPQTVGNDGILNLNSILPFVTRLRGLLVISVDNGPTAPFILGQDNATIDAANAILIAESVPNGVGFTANAPGTAGKHNVYYSAANDRFELQNKSGGTRDYTLNWHGNG